VPDPVNLELDRLVVGAADQLKTWMPDTRDHIGMETGEVVVKADLLFTSIHLLSIKCDPTKIELLAIRMR
jgi:hypothetical protein